MSWSTHLNLGIHLPVLAYKSSHFFIQNTRSAPAFDNGYELSGSLRLTPACIVIGFFDDEFLEFYLSKRVPDMLKGMGKPYFYLYCVLLLILTVF